MHRRLYSTCHYIPIVGHDGRDSTYPKPSERGEQQRWSDHGGLRHPSAGAISRNAESLIDFDVHQDNGSPQEDLCIRHIMHVTLGCNMDPRREQPRMTAMRELAVIPLRQIWDGVLARLIEGVGLTLAVVEIDRDWLALRHAGVAPARWPV